ncbi:MAG TPA: response regulator [Desulfomonilia bacterium]|nr:response regulator [Desulfomonilia bacterium]
MDDDIRIQRLLSEELEEEGYQILIASNGKDALVIINKPEKPDLVILDLRMPQLSGFETMKFISKLNIKIPVIIFSAYGTFRNDPMAMTADAYVVKSSDMTELKQKVRELISTL